MRNLAIINYKNPAFDRCPECHKTGVLHRSRARNFGEEIIKKLTFWGMYRCKSCGWRGYRSRLFISSRSFVNLFYYGVIILAAAFIVWSVLKRSDWGM
ncbi:MAG: hypothetical protein HF314_13420 [Ignavibacteria bacterium]|jgi:predicted RNA-binding Zn-ribbon protein involved in translation (DUF1610 family)|nr:hypothetical protein [Ignavibacteria bacterium]MCU7504076.1 hypothetical protein [Ignavibacteria bacterium]MCU7518255.1 hypothetical protein [Ignavibacteria bacterium]